MPSEVAVPEIDKKFEIGYTNVSNIYESCHTGKKCLQIDSPVYARWLIMEPRLDVKAFYIICWLVRNAFLLAMYN